MNVKKKSTTKIVESNKTKKNEKRQQNKNKNMNMSRKTFS